MISLSFFYISEKYFKSADRTTVKFFRRSISSNKLLGFIFVAIGIFIISSFAALRVDSVGADTGGYPRLFMLQASSSSSLNDLFRINPNFTKEILGGLLVFICSRFTKDTVLLLFMYQLLTVVPVFMSLYLMRNKISITTGMFVYYFLFFNNSLNMMRECVSCAFILLGFVILINTRKLGLKTLIPFIIASLFHRSGLYGTILILGLYYIGFIRKKYLKTVVILGIVTFPLWMSFLNQLADIFRINDEHILYYIDVFINKNVDVDWFINPLSIYSITYIIVCVSLAIYPILCKNNFFLGNIRKKTNTDAIYILLRDYNLVGMCVYLSTLFALNSMYGFRFSIYFDFLYIISLPYAISNANKKFKLQVLIFILMVFWFAWIMYMGWSGSQIYELRR
jgi:hypothetical protein